MNLDLVLIQLGLLVIMISVIMLVLRMGKLLDHLVPDWRNPPEEELPNELKYEVDQEPRQEPSSGDPAEQKHT